MTLDEQIQTRQRVIEVAGSKLSELLMKIRERGGFVPRMEVRGSHYELKIHWRADNEQRELM